MIPFRLGLQQRVFPAYREAFFDLLSYSCAGGLSVFAGEPMQDETIGQPGELRRAQYVPAHNVYLGQGSFLFVWQMGLRDWLEQWRPDVLVVEANPRNLSTGAALRWMHSQGRPVIGWGLGAPAMRPPFRGLSEAFRGQFLRQFDAVIAYSKTGMEQFAAAGVPAERVFVAPNAATPRPSQALPERLPTYRDGKPVILFVGRLQARKRVDALLRACAQLPDRLQPRLIIIGDGPAREMLVFQAREIYPAAEFAGARHGDALRPYYNAADLFVLPGTGGLAVQQAMSYGLPVMVAEADGTQSDLVRPENGWLLPPGDEAALVAALRDALADPARLRRMGQESYRIVAEEVNLEGMVEVFARVVQTVTGQR